MPDGVLYVPCGDRRASVCPPCAETYRADTYQLIRAGLVGGKGVPDIRRRPPGRVRHPHRALLRPRPHPQVNRKTGKVAPCRMRRDLTPCPHGRQLVCTARHTEDHPRLGRPICLDCYDHAHHVVWNAWAGELWRRTMITLTRSLQPLERAHGVKLRISYGKVAEYQRRGVVHFHALLRLDRVDPADPDAILPPPAGHHRGGPGELVAAAVTATAFRTPDYPDTSHSWPIEWGRQLDIRPSRVARRGRTPDVSTEAVAAYLAKYATKATEPTGLPVTGRMNGETAEHYSDPDTHLGRLIAYAWQLGTLPSPTDHRAAARRTGTTPTAGCAAGPTCSASAATSPPSPAATPPPTSAARRPPRMAAAPPAPTGANRHHRPATTRVDHDDDETTLIVCDLHLARDRLEHHRRRPTRHRRRRPRPRYRALAREEHTIA